MSASKVNRPTSPACADRDPFLTVDKNDQRHFSQIAWIQQVADDKHDIEATVQVSDGSRLFNGNAPGTFTPKRPATRATGQAGTQRAAEHEPITT